MANEQTQNRKPTHDVCHVKDRGEGKKGHWTKIGAAWQHDDDKGLSLALDFMPVNSDRRLVIRIVRDDSNKQEGK